MIGKISSTVSSIRSCKGSISCCCSIIGRRRNRCISWTNYTICRKKFFFLVSHNKVEFTIIWKSNRHRSSWKENRRHGLLTSIDISWCFYHHHTEWFSIDAISPLIVRICLDLYRFTIQNMCFTYSQSDRCYISPTDRNTFTDRSRVSHYIYRMSSWLKTRKEIHSLCSWDLHSLFLERIEWRHLYESVWSTFCWIDTTH